MHPFDALAGHGSDLTNRVVFGENAIERTGEFARELGGSRALVITDPGIVHVGIYDRARKSLERAGFDVLLFDGVRENPTTAHVNAATRFAQSHAPIDLIVGLGGGSSMDCAKGVNFLLTNGGVMEDYWGFGKASLPMLPSIGIPTTAGTGSEAQSYALIAQEATYRKMACGDPKARFHVVLLDPTLTVTVPRPIAAATGMDAISHALESYVSTARNPASQKLAREAWRLLESSYEIALDEPGNLVAQSGMLYGAHLAGMAIENSMLGAAHATANPLSAKYDLTHGVAVSLMLPSVVSANMREVGSLYGELARTAGLTGSVHKRTISLRAYAHLPERLRDCGVRSDDLPELAEAAALEWTGTFNPRELTNGMLVELYESAF